MRDRLRYWSDPEKARADYRARYAANPEPKRAACLAYAHRRRKPGESKPCKVCGEPTPTSHHVYCANCKPKDHRRRFNKTANREYGRRHQRIRAGWVPRVEAGLVNCARCGLPIEPGSPWDLGHDDNDRSRYVGPEHRACNRATAGREAQTRTSRPW